MSSIIHKLIAGLSILSTAQAQSTKESPTSAPNIVILYADDMGVADVSYGNTKAKIQTPHIDRLATKGMTFSDGHSSSSICTPSRYALLTGQHHWRSLHDIVKQYEPTVFKEDDFTIAKMLQKQGYNTACFGKWHLGWDWESIRKPGVKEEDYHKPEAHDWTKPFGDGPTAHGFDYYYGDGTINFPPYCWIENDRFVTPPTKPVKKPKTKVGTSEFRPGAQSEDWDPFKVLPTITAKTVEWIKQQDANKPFFAYVAFNSPHAPVIPNKEFIGKSKAGPYGDFVVETDAMVGKILTALEKKGISDNTIVIFTADNGSEKFAFQRLVKHKHWSSGDFRGLKRDIYEGGHRVPFIISWPGKIKENSSSDEVINQVDLAATLAAITGYPLTNEEAIDSYDLLPVLTSAEYQKPLRKASVHNTFKHSYALRQGDWLFINAPTGAANRQEPKAYLKHFNLVTFGKKAPGLLFNLKEDKRQSKNLYKDHPEIVKSMNNLLESYIKGTRCAPLRD